MPIQKVNRVIRTVFSPTRRGDTKRKHSTTPLRTRFRHLTLFPLNNPLHLLARDGEWLMSALGQKRTLRLVRLMSALPPKADIAGRQLNVRFVPKADIASTTPCRLDRGDVDLLHPHHHVKCAFCFIAASG